MGKCNSEETFDDVCKEYLKTNEENSAQDLYRKFLVKHDARLGRQTASKYNQKCEKQIETVYDDDDDEEALKKFCRGASTQFENKDFLTLKGRQFRWACMKPGRVKIVCKDILERIKKEDEGFESAESDDDAG